MSYTKFGEFMRILRIKKHEVMGDLAKTLSVSTAFLSAVECGKKNVPEDWVDVISSHYELSKTEKDELVQSIEDSKTQIKINLTNVDNCKREMALQFQRSFNDIDEETAKHIISILNSKED